MDHDELLEFREDMLDDIEECIGQELEYHELNLDGPAYGGSTINTNFGYIEERDEVNHPVTLVQTLPFYMRQKPHKVKRISKAGDEFEGEYDCRIYIPTQALVEKSVTLNREGGFLRLSDGAEFRFEAIQELPRTGNSSILTCCWCSVRKPQEDNPGQYG